MRSTHAQNPRKRRRPMPITIKNEREIEKMRAAGHVVALCHQKVEAAIAPGVTTADLDALVRDTVREHGALASFLGYNGFRGNICASVNEEIVHGIPGKRVLRDGDIIAVDIGAILDGWHGDSAWTYPVGEISDDARRLLRDTEEALNIGLSAAKAGNRLGEIGHAVEAYAAPRGYGIVRGPGNRANADPWYRRDTGTGGRLDGRLGGWIAHRALRAYRGDHGWRSDDLDKEAHFGGTIIDRGRMSMDMRYPRARYFLSDVTAFRLGHRRRMQDAREAGEGWPLVVRETRRR